MLHISLMILAPVLAAAPTPVFHEGLGLASMIHFPGTPYTDQETPWEVSLYQELASIPEAKVVTALQAIPIDGESIGTAAGPAGRHQQLFSTGLEKSRVSTHLSASPDPGNLVGQVSMSSVPLPGALSLFLTGLLCAAVVARKKLISCRREAVLD